MWAQNWIGQEEIMVSQNWMGSIHKKLTILLHCWKPCVLRPIVLRPTGHLRLSAPHIITTVP